MELSLSNKLLKINGLSRDRLFFDQYAYAFNFKVQEISALKGLLSHEQIDEILDQRNAWTRSPNFGGSWRNNQRIIDDKVRANCHAMFDFLSKLSDYKLVVSMDWGYIYTNDLAMLENMQTLDFLMPLSLKQAVVDRPRNSVVVKNSNHQQRSYFRSMRMTAEQKVNLRNFLISQEDVRLGPGLLKFVKEDQRYSYISDNNFLDHNGMGIVMMINLIVPKAIRKTVALLQHK